MDITTIKSLPGRYCNSLTEYSRFVTREVFIGDVPMGGNNPIRTLRREYAAQACRAKATRAPHAK